MRYKFRTEKHNDNEISIETRGGTKGKIGFRGDAFGKNVLESQSVWTRFDGDTSLASSLIFLGVLRSFIKDIELRGWIKGAVNLEIILNEQDLEEVFPSLRQELLLQPLNKSARALYEQSQIR